MTIELHLYPNDRLSPFEESRVGLRRMLQLKENAARRLRSESFLPSSCLHLLSAGDSYPLLQVLLPESLMHASPVVI